MSKVITVNGVEYVAKNDNESGSWKIVVLDRGWMVVGKVKEEGEYVFASNCSVIRRWGTEGKGIGYLAENGEQEETILDKCPDVKAHKLSIVMIMDCNDENWS